MAYEIVEQGRLIRCLQCGLSSYDPVDVERRWCPLCRMSHDEYIRLGLDAGRPKEPFRNGEKVTRGGNVFVVVDDEGFYGRVLDSGGAEIYPFHWFREGDWARRMA